MVYMCITNCAVMIFYVFSVALLCHMPASTQRLLLSFIYVHREAIPLSALADFTNALVAAFSTFSTSGWIKMLLDLLKIFCSTRTEVRLGGRFDSSARKELQCTDSPSVCHQNVGLDGNFRYSFSKQTADQASSVFHSLKEDVHRSQNGSSLWGPYCLFKGFVEQRTEVEKEIDFPDMETELSSAEFFEASITTATQHARTEDILSQKHTGMYNVVLCYR